MQEDKLKLKDRIHTPLFEYLVIIFLFSILIIGMIKKMVMAYILAIILTLSIIILLYYLIYEKLFTVKKEIKRKYYTVSYSYDKRKNNVYDVNGLDIGIKKGHYERFTKKIINILKKYSKKDKCGVEYIEYFDKKGKHAHEYKSCNFNEAFKTVKKYWNEDAPEIIIEGVYKQSLPRVKFYKYSDSILVIGNPASSICQ